MGHLKAEYDVAFLCYIQPANMTSQQYADSLVAEWCKIAEIHLEGSVSDMFIKSVAASLCRSFYLYWAQNPKAYFTDVTFQAEFFLSIRKSASKALKTQFNCKRESRLKSTLNNRNTTNVIKMDIGNSMPSSRRPSQTQPVPRIKSSQQQTTAISSELFIRLLCRLLVRLFARSVTIHRI